VTNAQMEFISWRMRLLAGFDVRNQISRIDAPVLYLAGEDDRLVNTQEEARVFREQVAESRTFLFPGCGHAVLAERPFECIELIDLFVPMAKRAAA
jgi:pimeloyl-ACP methyl ester carboxylesterase